MLNFLAKPVKKGEEPPVDGLDLLKLQIEAPMLWSESYELHGVRKPVMPANTDLSNHINWAIFKALCKVCNEFSDEFDSGDLAVHAHFEHCSRKHSYVFPENYDKAKLPVADRKLQYLIQDCQVYNLPFYGYDDHTDCIMQFRQEDDGKRHIVCAVHKGNEPVRAKKRLG
jgi:hypothetical protein